MILVLIVVFHGCIFVVLLEFRILSVVLSVVLRLLTLWTPGLTIYGLVDEVLAFL